MQHEQFYVVLVRFYEAQPHCDGDTAGFVIGFLGKRELLQLQVNEELVKLRTWV